jgi:nucleoside-diphosphate-sugar epimerase
MRILIAGGAGFVGSHLVDRLLNEGHQVVAVDNFVTGRRSNLEHLHGHHNLQLVDRDIVQPLDCECLGANFDQIYNLASPASPKGYREHAIETHLTNSIGAWHLLELALKHDARFVQASTSEIYGEPLVHPQVESYWGNVNPIGPRSCYDEGKRFAESLTMEYVRQHKLDARIARIFNTYGPRSKPGDGRVVPNFCVDALSGRPLTIYGSGSQTRSFCYVDDLVSGAVALMDGSDLAGEVVNLGNPAEITVVQLAQVVLETAGSKSTMTFHSLPVDDPTRRRPDISKAGRLLDWQPTTDLRTGIEKTIAYFRDHLNS